MKKNNNNKLEKYAKIILNDYDLKKPSIFFKKKIIINISDAYKVQSIITKLRVDRGERIIGYKIGSVSKNTQRKYGFSYPAWGRLWNSEFHRSGVKLFKKDYSNPSMEAEFGIKLKRDLDPKKISLNYIINSIETVHPIIEIHNLIFYGNNPFGAEHISNNAINAGIICGNGVAKPSYNKITDLKLMYDGNLIEKWCYKKWPYDILSAIEWFVKEQLKYDNILKKGDLVLTGAYGPPIPIKDKKFVKVNSSLFGNVSASFK